MLALVALAGVVVLWRATRGAQPDAARATEAAAPHQHDEELTAVVEVGRALPPPVSDAYPAELFSESRFEGTGRLQIYAFARGGAEFPKLWTLELAPSRVLMGGERAAHKRVELTGGERELALDDLPLGGYEIRAIAQGLNAPTQHVLLAKPAETNSVVHVEFHAAGYVTGLVVDERGEPVGGLAVVLEANATRERITAHTDPAGVYVIESVLDGEYTLFAGSADSPLAPAKELSFLAPSLHMPELRVPLLGEIAIQVIDARGGPAAGVAIEGYGARGGRIALTSDEQGRAVARHVAAGSITLIATASDRRQGRAKLELAAGARESATLRLAE